MQQIQYIAAKDLKGTRAFKRIPDTHRRNEPVPDLATRLSKECDDKHPILAWSENWEDMLIPVECVVAYWSKTLASTEREALAAKESLVRFQPFIEGERILLVTDHAALIWAKTYENANRRLAAWGLVFAAYPQLTIVHQPGRAPSAPI